MSDKAWLDASDEKLLTSEIAAGEKDRGDWRVGTEYETFGITDATRHPLSYDGPAAPATVRGVLEGLRERLGWEELRDGGALVGLKQGFRSVQLEPAGQVEFSGSPWATIREAEAEIVAFETEKTRLSKEYGIHWLWSGYLPVHGFDDLDLMPKQRYGIMDRYLPTRGKLAKHMMRRTTTVQANLDYGDEADMGRKLRTAMGVASLIAAIFANSPFRNGKTNGYRSFRTRIWDHTDPDRCGLLPWVFDGALPTYERYVRWAMDVPLFFIVRDGTYLDCAGLPFSTFLKKGFQSHRATLSDWHLHLSTLFPEVRLKTYLEVRSADCVPPHLLLALPALTKAILYHESALDATWDLVKSWSFSERLEHRETVARDALAAPIPGGHTTADIARELIQIARQSLQEQAKRTGLSDDSAYLDGIEALVKAGKSPADVALDWYHGQAEVQNNDLLTYYTANWPETS